MFLYSVKYSNSVDQNSHHLGNDVLIEPLDEINISNDKKIYIYSKSAIDLNVKYFPVFFTVDRNIREEIFNDLKPQTFYDENVCNSIFNYYIGHIDTIQNGFPDFSVCFNLSFGDYCVLIPETMQSSFDFDSFYKKLEILGFKREKSFESKQINELKTKIQEIFENKHVYKYLPQYDLSKKLISDLVNADVDTEEQKMECIVIAGNLLHYFLDELNIYMLQKNGDIRYIDNEMIEDLDETTRFMLGQFSVFLDQIRKNSEFCDCVWSYLFLTKGLLSEINKQKKNNEVNEFFSGFIPIIKNNTIELGTRIPDMVSPYQIFSFLHIPKDSYFNFLKHLPAFFHELFHYIPPSSQKNQNDIILKLTFQSAINILVNELSKQCGTSKARLSALIKHLHKSYQSITYLNTAYDTQNENDMFFLSKNMDLIQYFDFAKEYESLPNVINMTKNEIELHSALKNDCLNDWDKFSKSYLITFSMAFREIRSDIAMCSLLNLKLNDYVEIMMTEPTWATYGAKQTADSSIIRFGFVTRYLCFKESQKSKPFDNIEQFNLFYTDEIKKICFNLKNKYKKLSNNVDNILSYVSEYYDMMIECEQGYYTEQHHSEFESAIYPFSKIISNNLDSSIVELWEQDFEKYKKCEMIISISNIYKKYKDYISKLDYENVLKLNCQLRLISRDLPMYSENIYKTKHSTSSKSI